MKPRITIDMERRLATTIDVHRFIQDINAGKFDRIVEALAGDDIEAQEEAYMELDRLVSTYTANNNKYPQRQQQTVLALTAKELLGKNLPDEYDWHGAFPVCDENGLIEDIIDADGYSHITGLAWDLTEYRWNGEAYFPAYFPVDLGALKRTPSVKKQKNIRILKSFAKQGDTIYGTTISKGNMTRTIRIFHANNGKIRDISYGASLILEWPYDEESNGICVHGAGMDALQHTVNTLAYTIWGDVTALKYAWL